MQRELIYMLKQRICWADKEDIADALRVIRMDYEDLERERRMHADGDEADVSALQRREKK